jgi:hypothetical protein
MKTFDAAKVTMGIGVAVIAYGSLGYLMGAGVTSLDPAPIGIGVVILLVGAVWSRFSK